MSAKISNSTFQDFSPIIRGSNNKLIGYDFDLDEEAIKNSIRNIFTVQKGEVPGKPWFGNPLNIALFDLFDFFSEKDMEIAVQNALERWEPRINVIRIVVNKALEYNRIIIHVDYSYNVGTDLRYSDIDIPYTHNNISYIGGRIERPIAKPVPQICNLKG